MPEFFVEVNAEFRTSATSSDVIRTKLRKLLKQNGFEEQNFEFGIKKVRSKNSDDTAGDKNFTQPALEKNSSAQKSKKISDTPGKKKISKRAQGRKKK